MIQAYAIDSISDPDCANRPVLQYFFLYISAAIFESFYHVIKSFKKKRKAGTKS